MAATLTMQLREGSTLIAEWSVPITDDLVLYTNELTPAQIALVTDWKRLRYRVIADGGKVLFNWTKLSTPESPEQVRATTALVSRWIAVAASVVLGAVSSPATATSASWVVPNATATVGQVTTAASATLARWMAPDAEASLDEGQVATATPSVAIWVAPAATAAPGAVSTSATAAQAAWVAPNASATVGGVTTAATPAVAIWVALAATAAPGAVSTSATAAQAAWVAPNASATVGSVTTAANAAVAIWVAPAATAAPGAVSTSATAAQAAWVAPNAIATIEGGDVATATPAVVQWVVPTATATPGAVSRMTTAVGVPWVVPNAVTWTPTPPVPGGGGRGRWAYVPPPLQPIVTPAVSARPVIWVVPAAVAITGDVVTTVAQPALFAWTVPGTTASPQAVSRQATPARLTWVVPAAGAYTTRGREASPVHPVRAKTRRQPVPRRIESPSPSVTVQAVPTMWSVPHRAPASEAPGAWRGVDDDEDALIALGLFADAVENKRHAPKG